MSITSRLKGRRHSAVAAPVILLLLLLLPLIMTVTAKAEDGYRLWLRYDKIPEQAAKAYRARIKSVIVSGNSETLAAAREELKTGVEGLLGVEIATAEKNIVDGAILVGTPKSSAIIAGLLSVRLTALGDEGFIIRSIKSGNKNIILIASNSETGALYGAFHFLRLIQTLQPVNELNISEKPRLQIRMLNHWDNPDGSIERGYAGKSLWNWAELPGRVDSRLRDYARANASTGINGAALNNVNADARILTPEYLKKVAAIAEVFRPFGIKVYLSARFSAPVELGGLKTADPFDENVKNWWKKKAGEIYRLIPDFGGFLVKANSEGQPRPRTYNRTHADGANMLAAALAPHYNGQPSKSVTPLEAIKNKLPRAEILYSPGMYPTGVVFEPVAETAFSDLKGEYFNNRELKGEPALVRRDAQIAFNWGALSPAKEVSENDFSVRWTARLIAPESGKYQFGWRGNGGVRIFLDNRAIADEPKNPWTRSILREIILEAGKTYDLRVEYFENANLYAASKLVWSPPAAQEKLRADALEKARQSDAVVMVMGISPMIEGEEMDVKLEGFRGGDRTDIALPQPQQDLIKAVRALGKPVILVLMGGSALAVNWESENIPAILHAWYPGQEGGTAIADVLFGDYNPAGRLPVTFYKSVVDLPPFDDYKMAGRTYRYFKGEPLYPFGYGLSYTKFAYSNLKFKRKIKTGENLQISVDVRNTGATQGDEAVQLYVANQKASVAVPIRSLEGVSRIALKPGEKKTVSFTLKPRQLSVVLGNGKRIAESSEFLISIGGKQPGFSGRADAATTTTVSERLTVSGKTVGIPE